MRNSVFFFAFLCTAKAATVSAGYLPVLPAGATPQAVAVDPSGFVVLAGDRATGSNTTAFVAKVSANGSSLQYYYETGGSNYSSAQALAVGSDGSVYVTGTTGSTDFPTTDGSTFGKGDFKAFVWKLGPDGSTAYEVLIGGDANTSGSSIAVNSNGGAFITGQAVGDFPVTPGGMQSSSSDTYYIARLDNSGSSLIYAITGLGGVIAIDGQNNAYIAGVAYDPTTIPVTSGAFQPAVPACTTCGASGGGPYQYVCKIDPSGTQILFCTFVTGSNGPSYGQIAVDSAGKIHLVGATTATDYPVTSNALQATNNSKSAQPITSYYTQLSADGSQLLYSTYLGGSGNDNIDTIAFDGQGTAYLAALVESADFPGLPQTLARCGPQVRLRVPVLIQLSSDGTSIASETLVEEASACGNCGVAMTVTPQGKAYLTGSGPFLAAYDPSVAPSPDAIACVTDSADYAHAGPVAPGELLTIFGSGLASSNLLINGVTASTLYATGGQINFELPPGTTGNSVRLDLSAGGKTIASRTLRVTAQAPSLLLGSSDAVPSCGGTSLPDAVNVLAINEDGSVNACGQPAAPGSAVTVYLNGAGGSAAPVVQNANASGITVQNVAAASGLWAVTLRLPGNASGYIYAAVSVQGVPVREQPAVIWVSSPSANATRR